VGVVEGEAVLGYLAVLRDIREQRAL